MKASLSNVMWIGRATVFTVGLAVILAVMLGGATTALAAVPGDPFRLGKFNYVDQLTALVGETSGAMLRVANNGTGPALSLDVGADRPPLRVNPDSGKATNLDADRLDGKDSTAFLPSDSKASDSELLDGKDSAEFALANHSHPGSEYKNVVVVAKTGGDFTSIQTALDSITDTSNTNHYLVWVAPGTYNERVTMKQFVDIEGAGEKTTTITASGGNTLQGANDAELRYLTVRNTGSTASPDAIAIHNDDVAPSLLHITATASGGGSNKGVYNYKAASPTMTDVTATGSGGQLAYGVDNSFSSPTIRDSVIVASGATGVSRGLETANGGTVTVENSVIKGVTNTVGNLNDTKIRIAATRLEGGPTLAQAGGTVTCAGVYDENYAFYASMCP